jgi:hypothetical protein
LKEGALEGKISLLALNNHVCQANHILLWNEGILSLGKYREFVLYAMYAGTKLS